jgi:hypothetical protein
MNTLKKLEGSPRIPAKSTTIMSSGTLGCDNIDTTASASRAALSAGDRELSTKSPAGRIVGLLMVD